MNRFFESRKNGLTKEDFIDADPDIDLSNFGEKICINSLSTLENANDGDLSFFTITLVSGNKYYHYLENTKASFCLMKKQYANINNKVKAIITDEPYITFVRLCNKLFSEKKSTVNEKYIASSADVSKNAVVGDGTIIGNDVVIGDFVRIGNGVKIGDGSVIKSGSKIGNNCIIGCNCVVEENCSIQYTEIGDKCYMQPNVAIGQDGFGYTFDKRTGKNEKVNHFGYVKIGNCVEIGANSCIDRGVFSATIIGDDTKIDNLVQIAHNVKIGSGTMIAGCSGIAGSATIGRNCMIGGKCGVVGHISIGDKCIVYGGANVTKSFPNHSKIIGYQGELYHIWVRRNSLANQYFSKVFKKRFRKKESVNFLSYLRKFFSFK